MHKSKYCILSVKVQQIFSLSKKSNPSDVEWKLSPRIPVQILGKTNFLAGYTDYGAFKGILKATESSWLNITESNIASEVLMSQENRMWVVAAETLLFQCNICRSRLSLWWGALRTTVEATEVHGCIVETSLIIFLYKYLIYFKNWNCKAWPT